MMIGRRLGIEEHTSTSLRQIAQMVGFKANNQLQGRIERAGYTLRLSSMDGETRHLAILNSTWGGAPW